MLKNQEQKMLNGKLIYKLNFTGEKVPVLETEDAGDIVIEETPGSITLTTRGTLLIMEKELRDHWEKQQTIAKRYKRHSNNPIHKTIIPIYDAIDPTIRVTDNGQMNYMNPDEAAVMDGLPLLNLDDLKMETQVYPCHGSRYYRF